MLRPCLIGITLLSPACGQALLESADVPCVPSETRCASLGVQVTCAPDGLSWLPSPCGEQGICASREIGGRCHDRGDAVRTLEQNLEATLRFETVDGGVCTAFLVNASTVLTNAHCCRYRDEGCTGGSITFAYRNVETRYERYPVIRTVFVNGDHDVSALEVAGLPAELPRPVEIARRRGTRLLEEQIYLIGHPSGRPQESTLGIVWGFAPEVTYAYGNGDRTKHEQIAYWSRAEGGNSGSPIFALHGHVLVGIHHTGGVKPDLFGLTTADTDGFANLLAGTDGAAIADLLDEHGIEFDELEEE